jgi:toxin ParE1/3/4
MPGVPGSREPQFTDAAIGDLDEIEEYICQNNPSAAARVIRRIQEVCFTLAEQPVMGRSRPELAPNLHSFPEGSYVIYYRLSTDTVEIMRVYHKGQDIELLFRQECPIIQTDNGARE